MPLEDVHSKMSDFCRKMTFHVGLFRFPLEKRAFPVYAHVDNVFTTGMPARPLDFCIVKFAEM